METVKNVGTVVIISAIVAGGIVFVFNGGTEVVREIRIPSDQLGAIPGSEIDGNYFTIGGVEFAHITMQAVPTSSAPCVVKNPWNATSTLTFFSASFSDAPVDLTPSLDLSTSTNAYLSATNTPAFISNFAFTSDSVNDLIWQLGASSATSSNLDGQVLISQKNPTDGATPILIKSGEFVGLKNGTSTPGPSQTTKSKFVGQCTASFRKL